MTDTTNPDPSTDDSPNDSPNDSPTEIVRRAIQHLGAFEIDAVLALTTDDLVLEFPFRGDGGPRQVQGADARAFMRAMPKLFTSLPFHDVEVHGELPSGQVVAEYKSNGLTRSGRSYPNAYIAIFTLRDGRIAHWREYFDPMVVAATFGG
ncbi:MAG: nuclear transport factor 2 family protein [Actinomycetota bacterium]|nr:nuclear transport factor 2 family protein [Actinomycetota bacterium]